jgi:ammonia channel protein AmtB
MATAATAAMNVTYTVPASDSLDAALTSSWSMAGATIILLTGQVGFCLLELAQTYKKNRDFIVLKNLMVILTVVLTWFAFGYAIAFGTNPEANDIQFAGFYHGWFGDLSGGVEILPSPALANATTSGGASTNAVTEVPAVEYNKTHVAEETYDQTVIFNQRRFFVYLAFMILASNIATSSVAERVKLRAIIAFVFLQNVLIVPVCLCWAYARPMQGSSDATGGLGFLYNFGFFDRAGAIPILYAGALTSLVASAVLGPRYGVFMPIDDQQKIAGGAKEERQKGIMTLLQLERDSAFEIDELYLYKVRKLIKRELTQGNVESGIDLPKMIFGTFTLTICFCMMNTLGLNSQFDLFSQQARYNANFGFINPILSGATSGLISFVLKRYLLRSNVGNHLFDVKALCNGFLAGVVAVSVGSGGM